MPAPASTPITPPPPAPGRLPCSRQYVGPLLPCAACTLLGLTCTLARCPMAPYFPAERRERFRYAFHLFGIKTILRSIRAQVPGPASSSISSLWKSTFGMAAIVFTADASAADPARLSDDVRLKLSQQLDRLKAFRAILMQQKQQNKKRPQQQPPYAVETAHDSTSTVDAAAALATRMQMLRLNAAAANGELP
uniref:LOB domain-containing protein n=1 Tax=Leersia perrieri TaxID=77586 RepID=A0A0D9V264_9ORYZ